MNSVFQYTIERSLKVEDLLGDATYFFLMQFLKKVEILFCKDQQSFVMGRILFKESHVMPCLKSRHTLVKRSP